MTFLKSSHDGEIMLDHRASPGIPQDMALRLGYHPAQVAEGKVFECATYCCPHCTGVVVKNPLRVRERGYCFRCDSNVCDTCAAIMQESNYVHMPVKKIADLVQSGKYTLKGSMGRPILQPTGE